MNEKMERWKGGRMNGRMEGWMEGWMNEWMEGKKERSVHEKARCCRAHLCLFGHWAPGGRHTRLCEGQIDIQAKACLFFPSTQPCAALRSLFISLPFHRAPRVERACRKNPHRLGEHARIIARDRTSRAMGIAAPVNISPN